jgi:hypothetical protein
MALLAFYNSPPSTAMIKNAWSYTPFQHMWTTLYLLQCCGSNFLKSHLPLSRNVQEPIASNLPL